MISTSSFPNSFKIFFSLKFDKSRHKVFDSGKFVENVFIEFSSKSIPPTILNPFCLKPLLIPPHPQNKSKTFINY